MQIDTTFDFRTDAFGKDPDTYSATLRNYHRHLWSKPLPNGRHFTLDVTTPGAYLHHQSSLGEFSLSSDSMIPSFTTWKSMQQIIGAFPQEEIEAFRTIGYSIGGMMIFPANRVDGKLNINGARGFNRKIADRFDLTLECIRRHYLGETSPLSDTLSRYRDFFELFEGFKGYVDFFLLQDLVRSGGTEVDFFMTFDDFKTSSVPSNVDEYTDYRDRSIQFVRARNQRIGSWAISAS